MATPTYTYNARTQITKEKVQNGAPATTWERDYTYTAAGLRTKIDDLFNEWECSFQHDPAGRLSLVQTTDNSGGGKSNPFPWWEGDTRVSTSPNGDVVSMVSGANRITYRYDEENRLVEAQMATGDPVKVTYDGGGNLVSIVQGATTQKTLTSQGRILQTRNASDVLQDRLFWVGGHFVRLNVDAAARNQTWDMRGSNVLSYQTDGTMDKARMWDNWGLESFAAGAGSAPDVGFLSNFDLGSSGLSITPQNNAWWAELGRSVEGGWKPRHASTDEDDFERECSRRCKRGEGEDSDSGDSDAAICKTCGFSGCRVKSTCDRRDSSADSAVAICDVCLTLSIGQPPPENPCMHCYCGSKAQTCVECECIQSSGELPVPEDSDNSSLTRYVTCMQNLGCDRSTPCLECPDNFCPAMNLETWLSPREKGSCKFQFPSTRELCFAAMCGEMPGGGNKYSKLLEARCIASSATCLTRCIVESVWGGDYLICIRCCGAQFGKCMGLAGAPYQLKQFVCGAR